MKHALLWLVGGTVAFVLMLWLGMWLYDPTLPYAVYTGLVILVMCTNHNVLSTSCGAFTLEFWVSRGLILALIIWVVYQFRKSR